ncbi:hypothetical protein B0H16DRAFT_1730942 [Mycena metata]|uniref:Uncharacterized protein n=1 Tax=Mycena metata TaxID=1033252 RepID=A0AAD7I7G4_9AGAR|nr:hypothetical protein B0H16DRAFT_1730942 [Mycena metata]
MYALLPLAALATDVEHVDPGENMKVSKGKRSREAEDGEEKRGREGGNKRKERKLPVEGVDSEEGQARADALPASLEHPDNPDIEDATATAPAPSSLPAPRNAAADNQPRSPLLAHAHPRRLDHRVTHVHIDASAFSHRFPNARAVRPRMGALMHTIPQKPAAPSSRTHSLPLSELEHTPDRLHSPSASALRVGPLLAQTADDTAGSARTTPAPNARCHSARLYPLAIALRLLHAPRRAHRPTRSTRPHHYLPPPQPLPSRHLGSPAIARRLAPQASPPRQRPLVIAHHRIDRMEGMNEEGMDARAPPRESRGTLRPRRARARPQQVLRTPCGCQQLHIRRLHLVKVTKRSIPAVRPSRLRPQKRPLPCSHPPQIACKVIRKEGTKE